MYDIAIVGAGAVGTTLGRALASAGHVVSSVTSRSASSARHLSGELGSAAVRPLDDLPGAASVVLLCVPDREIEAVAIALAHPHGVERWNGQVVLHTSGALDSEALRPLSRCGARTGSFHPVLSLVRNAAPSVFTGARVHLEGDSAAVEVGGALASSIGARPHTLSSSQKLAVHVAAAIASNYLVTLAAISTEILVAGDISPDQADVILRPLMQGTLDNIEMGSVERSLTGPIARGDLVTLALHLEALATLSPGLSTVYCCLATETLRVAARGGFLTPDQAQRVQSLIVDSLENISAIGSGDRGTDSAG